MWIECAFHLVYFRQFDLSLSKLSQVILRGVTTVLCFQKRLSEEIFL